MKIVIAALVFAWLAPCHAELIARALYGNDTIAGRFLQTEDACNETEWESIYGEERRSLLRSRDLCTFVSYDCNRKCRGWPKNHCKYMHPHCKCTSRRELDETSSTCETELEELEDWHTAAYDDLSPSCQAFVDTRRLECYEGWTSNNWMDNVNSLNLMNADLDVFVKRGLEDGDSFCEGAYPFSIHAAAGYYVNSVKFELGGPGNFLYVHTETSRPFTLFADTGTFWNLDANGTYYEPGEYNLLVTPNPTPGHVAVNAQLLLFTIKNSTDLDCQAPDPTNCNHANFDNECWWNRKCEWEYPEQAGHQCVNHKCMCGDQSHPCGCLTLNR